MIVSSRFSNDPIWVQELQHDLYWSSVNLPFELARKTYIKAEKTVGIETQLGQDCRAITGIDHRVLQNFHDTIAMKFRFDSRNAFEMHLPGVLDSITEEDDIKQRWLHYFSEQIEVIFDDHQTLIKQVIIAVTYPNPDEMGKKAEEYIESICDALISSIKENDEQLLAEHLSIK